MLLAALACLAALSCNKQQDVPNPEPTAKVVGTPLDSRWQITQNLASANWRAAGICYATAGEGRNKAYITAVSETGNELSFGSASGLSVTGLQEGDYLLFGVPMEDLEKSTDIDFFLTIDVSGNNAPSEWIFEYKSDGEWKKGRTFATIGSSTSSNTTFIEHFTTSEPIQNDTLLMRCKITRGGSSTGTVCIAPFNFEGCRILAYPASKFPATTETKKIAALGNSFSFYYAPVWMMKEIARSEGHQIDLRMNVKGGLTLGQHLSLKLSKAVAKEGGYDYAILQDQSTKHSSYYNNPKSSTSQTTLSDTKNLVSLIHSASPDCAILLENTWAYSMSNFMSYGSYEAFDAALIGGTTAIAAKVGATPSPIGTAFASARAAGFNTEYSDNKHQSEYAAYLKACVNYLMIYGKPFTKSASDCNLPHKAALELQKIAEQTVIN